MGDLSRESYPGREDPRLDKAVTGALWQHKRDRGRTVHITILFPGRDGVRYVGVRRNTSRRRQAISEKTLLREYEFARMVEHDG